MNNDDPIEITLERLDEIRASFINGSSNITEMVMSVRGDSMYVDVARINAGPTTYKIIDYKSKTS